MRQYIDLAESADPFLPMVKAVWRQQSYDTEVPWSEMETRYADFKQEFIFPMTIYRGISFGEHISFDAKGGNLEEYGETHFEETKKIMAGMRNLDLSRSGVIWSDKLEKAEGNCILVATATADMVDIPRTIFQNLADATSPSEIRLYPGITVQIIGILPTMEKLTFPLNGNTGPVKQDKWDIEFAHFIGELSGRG